MKETFFLFCWMQSTWQLTWPAEEDISIFILKNICFLVDHWKDESASGKLHKGNDIYISNVFCKLITRLYICLVTPPRLPLWTDNFVPTPPNVCWTISHSLQKKLGCLSFTGCDETGSMLSRVALWDCSGGRYRFFYWLLESCAETGSKCLTKQSHNAIPRNTDPGPVHTYSIMFENGDFSPSVCEKMRVHK